MIEKGSHVSGARTVEGNQCWLHHVDWENRNFCSSQVFVVFRHSQWRDTVVLLGTLMLHRLQIRGTRKDEEIMRFLTSSFCSVDKAQEFYCSPRTSHPGSPGTVESHRSPAKPVRPLRRSNY